MESIGFFLERLDDQTDDNMRRDLIRDRVLALDITDLRDELEKSLFGFQSQRRALRSAEALNQRLLEEVQAWRNMPQTVDERIMRLKSSMQSQDYALNHAEKRLKEWQRAFVTMVSMLDVDDIEEGLDPKRSTEFLQLRELRAAMDWYAATNRDLLAENIQYVKEIEELKNAQSSKSDG